MVDFKNAMGKTGAIVLKTGLAVLAVVALISFKLLLDGNMGTLGLNEGDVLPLARQFVDRDWMPNDWYLNQPAGYRFLFQTIFGHLITAIGFLATSLVGRLVCYSLVAWGLVRLGQNLGISSIGLLLTITWLVYFDQQSFAAREWFLGGLEAKAVAYGLVMLAIGLLLEQRYLWMALALGLATSFHVLVGGWAFLVVLSWLLLRWKSRITSWANLGWVLLIYLTASVFVWKAVYDQLATPTPTGAVLPSYIYVFVRLPHHLSPLSWDSEWLTRLLIYLVLLSVSAVWLHKRKAEKSKQHQAQMGLVELTLLSLVPFAIGLVVALFDQQGVLLQYYPFRLGAILLPLGTGLLVICAIEQVLQEFFAQKNVKVVYPFVCLLLISGMVVAQLPNFQEQLIGLKQFPNSEDQGNNPDAQALYQWIRTNTPTDATLVASPVDLYSLTWLTQRATIANYKFFPQSKAGIIAWYERISDLSGSVSPWSIVRRDEDSRNEIRHAMITGYNSLTTSQAMALMKKYKATYMVTQADHTLALPIAYRNDRYILYFNL
jgi:hypothetical protein